MSRAEHSYLETIRAHAAATPDNLAFQLVTDSGGFVLTYRGLAERVKHLGHALHGAGYGNGARVAICMENRPSWPVAYLSIWYSGGVTVPLDPQLDSASLGRLLEHSAAVACITSSRQRRKLDEACSRLASPPLILQVDAAGEAWEGDPIGDQPSQTEGATDLPDGVISLDEFAGPYPSQTTTEWTPQPPAGELGSIMYTSGTTGEPKGVMIRRTAVVENIREALKRVQVSSADRVLGVLPLFHVLPLIANCLGPLYLGATVVFLSELTAESIMAAFRRHRITVFVCVPAFFYRFHDRLRRRLRDLGLVRKSIAKSLLAVSRVARRHFGINLGPRLLRAAHRPFGDQMRLFVTGGAKMSAEVLEDFLDWGFTLVQGYGLTEATAVLTLTPLDQLRGDTVGVPIDGVELAIHQPDGEGVGEIWARGANVMEGYYRNPQATEEVLVDGWLRTGDLGRLLPNGHLQVTGRAKDVIVLASGKNIYPEELEEHYGQCDLIEEIGILGIGDPEGRGERLHAIVVPDLEVARKRGYVNIREMVKWELETLGSKLPSSRRITSLELRNQALPRTTTRKVKRFLLKEEIERRMRATATGEAEPADAPVRPATAGEAFPEWERQVRQMIADHAKIGRVQRQDHLDLDLGLESLDRVELFAEIQDSLGLTLGDHIAGELHTVGEILEALAAHRAGTAPRGERPADWDRWSRVLAERPADLEPYLRRRPLTELLTWVWSRKTKLAYSLLAGYRAAGLQNVPTEFPFLICANHASYIDPFVLTMALPLRTFRRCFFVGFSEYFRGWAGRRIARLFRNIPIDPNRHLERALQAAAEGLRRGMVLVIFPEGGRSIDGELREFRRGAAILARHLEVPIVPAGIWGTYQVWPRGGSIRRHPVAISLGEPLWPGAGSSHAEVEAQMTDRLQSEVVRLAEEARNLYRAPIASEDASARP